MLTAAQYADDTKAILKSLGEEEVKGFLEVMRVFERASGQRMNEDKTELLPIGAAPQRPLSIAVCNLKVTHAARGVGITFSNDAIEGQPAGTQRRQAGMPRRTADAPPVISALEAEVNAGAAAHRLGTAPATRRATSQAARAAAAAATAATLVPTTADTAPAAPAGSEDDKLLSYIKAKYGTLAKLGLSIFGRAAGAGAYGVSTMLFNA